MLVGLVVFFAGKCSFSELEELLQKKSGRYN